MLCLVLSVLPHQCYSSAVDSRQNYSHVHTSNLTEFVSASLWLNIFVPWSWSLWIYVTLMTILILTKKLIVTITLFHFKKLNSFVQLHVSMASFISSSRADSEVNFADWPTTWRPPGADRLSLRRPEWTLKYVSRTEHYWDTLSNRRNQLCMTFFEKCVLDKSGCLYYLLPPQRDVCDRLWH